MVDWGWFYFLTKPMFYLLDFLNGLVGNFGIAILIATLLVKAVVFPLANKSYASMSKMKKLQPEMAKLKEALSRRQDEAAAGDDGALQAREGLAAVGLPAGGRADSGVLLALQGHPDLDRIAPCAVLRLDSRSLRARSDQPVQSLRPHPVDAARTC